MVYRAYRVPYDWIPQLDTPREASIIPPLPSCFNITAGRRPATPPPRQSPSTLPPPPPPEYTPSSGEKTVINALNFEAEILRSSVPALVYFWAPWCKHCKFVSPLLDQLALKYAGRLKIGAVNVDEEKGLAEKLQIMSTPTLIVYKDGGMTGRKNGTVSKGVIESMFKDIV